MVTKENIEQYLIEKCNITPGPWVLNEYFKCVQSGPGDLCAVAHLGNSRDPLADANIVKTSFSMLVGWIQIAFLVHSPYSADTAIIFPIAVTNIQLSLPEMSWNERKEDIENFIKEDLNHAK